MKWRGQEVSSEILNIQPKAGILGVFSRLNYKPWYAIGEFVDNSTASYFGHERSMKFYKFNKLTIYVEYDAYKNILTVTDDAYGMEIEDFKRAVLLDSKPDNLNGRNEFGMGLKTAASWFGNIWSVKSTQLGSENQYFAEVNIQKLREEESNSIEIIKTKTDLLSHGTVITIKDITKKIDAATTKKKIKDLLSSMYRRDIHSGKVDIFFNGEKLSFENSPVLKFRNNEWKRDVNFTFEFDGKKYNVTGFVAIMAKGSYPKAGFSLFRYDRVVVGGYDTNYKPYGIFGQAQSQISLKLFGELNMEDFPVNQAKDGFVWDDGLEDEFVLALKRNIKDYIDIAALSTQQRVDEENIDTEKSEKVEENVSKEFENIILDDETTQEKNQENTSDVVEQFRQEMKEADLKAESSISSVREYPVRLDPVNTKIFKVYWKIGDSDKWIDYNEKTSEIIININHPFFKPYCTEESFKVILDKFVVSFISAEELAKKASSNNGNGEGYILPSVFRNKMNNILKKLCEDR